MGKKLLLLLFCLSMLGIPASAQTKHSDDANPLRITYADLAEQGGTVIGLSRWTVNDFQCVPNPGNPATGLVRLYCDSGTGNLTCLTSSGASCFAGGGSGTVTSVSFVGGLITVATPTTTPALTVAGTSGGIPYFSSASTWASSTAPAANTVMLWGGAATAPIGTTADSTTTHALFATAGAPAFRAIATGDLPTAIPIGNVGSAGLSGTAPVTISAAGAIGCATCTTNASALTNNVLVKGAGGQATQVSLVTDNGTTATYTGTGGYSAPVLVSTVATGTAPLTVTSTTAVANLTLSTAAQVPNLPLQQIISPTGAVATYALGTNVVTFNCATASAVNCFTMGETTAATTSGSVESQISTLTTSQAIPLQITQGANGPAATNAPAIINISAAAAGGLATASVNGFTGAPITLRTGAGSGGGATTGNGGTGGTFSVTTGGGGAAGGTTTNTGGVGGAVTFTMGAGTAGAATGAGGAAGALTYSGGTGGAGGATSGTGGAGSDFLVNTGTGGAATAGSTTGRGGNAVFTLGAAGATGTAGTPGNFQIAAGTVGAALTTSFLNLTGTWNTTGVVDAGIFENITNTASGAGSLLIDLQLGGVSELKLEKTGLLTANNIIQSAVGTQIISGADYTNSTVTPSTVFSWTLPATAVAKNYRYSCDITWESTNTTLVGPVFGLNLSAAPTQLTGTGWVMSSLAAFGTTTDSLAYLSNTTTGSQTLVTGNAAATTTTNYQAKIWGTIEGAATAGSTFIINAASTSGTTATLNIRRGSACTLN